ncbi:MAG: hypothetical protein WC091_23600, partial [Sulfuricellaceae bacterium]
PGAWRRCNSLQWNDHCASLRLALHPENRTLQPVQRRFLGLICSSLRMNYLSMLLSSLYICWTPFPERARNRYTSPSCL